MCRAGAGAPALARPAADAAGRAGGHGSGGHGRGAPLRLARPASPELGPPATGAPRLPSAWIPPATGAPRLPSTWVPPANGAPRLPSAWVPCDWHAPPPSDRAPV